jgi:hypothetical protein
MGVADHNFNQTDNVDHVTNSGENSGRKSHACDAHLTRREFEEQEGAASLN